MDKIIVEVPEGFEIVYETLFKKDWIISTYDIDKTELYNPANYLYNKIADGVTYKLILDRNIFSFLLSAIRKKETKQIHRDAISLVAFCQISEILIEPNFAIYEKINYCNDTVDEAVEELLAFYKIDNLRNDILMKFISRETDLIDIPSFNKWGAAELKDKLTRVNWLAEWKSLYLIVLNLVYINYQDISRESKINSFFNWMVKEFRLSLVSIVYAVFLFSSKRMKQMMKFKINAKKDTKILQLKNMTWDLYFMNYFFRLWQSKDEKTEIIVDSDDKIIIELLRIAISVQKKESLNMLKEYLHPDEKKYLTIIETIITSTEHRAYDSNKWTPEHRDNLIQEREKILLNEA
jgi:hypothetical protein